MAQSMKSYLLSGVSDAVVQTQSAYHSAESCTEPLDGGPSPGLEQEFVKGAAWQFLQNLADRFCNEDGPGGVVLGVQDCDNAILQVQVGPGYPQNLSQA
jgi:hypothetical protein